jgi:hypothetical protein
MFGNRKGRKAEEDLRVDKVVVHVTTKEKEMLAAIAKENGMNPSTFIRTVCIYNKFNSMFKEG